MAVSTRRKRFNYFHRILGNEKGQSVFEFFALLPVILGLISILIQVNHAIQASIVNQQYARAQTLFLTFNSPVFPSLRFRETGNPNDLRVGQMVLGVADNIAPSEGEFRPRAIVQSVVRPGQAVVGNQEQDEPSIRSIVRVRNSVSLCTQFNPLSENIVTDPVVGNFQFCVGKHEL